MSKNISELRFGTGGNPLSTSKIKDKNGKYLSDRESGLYRIHELGLNHMEIEFVYGVNIDEEKAISLREIAQQLDISLTVHAPYYINLASKEKPKYYASLNRIQKTIWAAELMNAKSITFHPAFYQNRSPEDISKLVENAIEQIFSDYQQKDGHLPEVLISPETTGKISQWGTVDEILEISSKINEKFKKFVSSICIDFAHIHARSNGEYNTLEEFNEILTKIKSKLGQQALSQLHIHTSGINYNEKGERNHLTLEKSDLNYKELLKTLKENKIGGYLVCESPNLEEDAILMKNYTKELG
ncbi:TIM barrel protein [Candidatus Dojkabacteria bacterium]|nr:TIM barrel protein [Candidatus Dojkabacteria bacterium]